MIYNSLTQLIGETPMLRLARLSASKGVQAEVIAKLESFNPGGSVKDRVALQMIVDAEACGLLRPGSVIIEPTSGNTGVGLAWVSRVKGYETVLVMPDSMSLERRRLLSASGARLVLTDGKLGMKGAIDEAERLQRETPRAVILGQFNNPSNPKAHFLTTGPEIIRDTEGNVDVFVAGVGTGGTLTGVARYLRLCKETIEVVGVEPSGSAVLNGGEPGPHGLQGIGAGFIPEVYDASLVDKVLTVADDEAFAACRELAEKEGLLAGISSGAALHAAYVLASQPQYAGKRIVVLLPDTGERYLSTSFFEN